MTFPFIFLPNLLRLRQGGRMAAGRLPSAVAPQPAARICCSGSWPRNATGRHFHNTNIPNPLVPCGCSLLGDAVTGFLNMECNVSSNQVRDILKKTHALVCAITFICWRGKYLHRYVGDILRWAGCMGLTMLTQVNTTVL